MTSVVEVRGLRYRYPDGTEALRGVDFDLQAGESVALLGANGSGKSTFALHLNGLLEGEGMVRVCGMEVTRATLPAVRRKVGLVFQDSDTQLFMPTVLEDVAFGLLNLGMTSEKANQRAQVSLEQVGMSAAPGRAPHHLSAGEKKRVALAGILALEPERALAELLRNLPQAKILITHDMPFARATCSRAVFFREGCVASDGTVNDIAGRFGWDFSDR
jgi:cobalt/nickel transport system ATP-binding protein